MSGFRPVSAAKCRKTCPNAIAQVEKARANARFLEQNHKKLAKQYPNEWVAIVEGRVVAHGAELDEVAETLATRGINPADALTQFLSDTEHIFIL
jgi:hypothetical protein